MNFIGTAKRLADTDLPRLGATIGVGEDEVHAFLDVETNGHGYDAQGRPKMLFEPHRFYAWTSGVARSRAMAAGVAYPTQGERPYPDDSYPRLSLAMSIDEEAALQSASWGLGQVMGENHVAAGYRDVRAFVTAMVDGGEAAQLEAAIDFILANHLDDELRAHNWAAFARGYNGPKYARNGYDAKLATAYRHWSAIRDTPFAPPVAQTLNDALRSPGGAARSPALAPPAKVVPPISRPPAAPTAAAAKPGFWSRFLASFTGKAAA